MNKTTCVMECDTLGNSLKQVHIYNYIYTISTVINYVIIALTYHYSCGVYVMSVINSQYALVI